MKNNCIIFGRSPYINTIRDKIPSLQERYDCIGINSFPVSFPNCPYWGIHDLVGLRHLKEFEEKWGKPYEGLLLTQQQHQKTVESIGKFNCWYYTPALRAIVIDLESHLVGFSEITLSCVLNWCLKQGYTNIYLAGHSLTNKWDYFDSPNVFRQCDSKIYNARSYIYDMAKFVNIYQLDPNNDMKLPKYNIDWLI